MRLGVGTSNDVPILNHVDWAALLSLANKQGLLGVVMDGMDMLPKELQPAKKDVIKGIGKLLQIETLYEAQEKMAEEMALRFHNHGIRTFVLKGTVVAECYPKPEHRRSVDMDCYLTAENGGDDVWERGNKVMEDLGYEVRRDYYKNSTIVLPGLTVENHRYFTPFRGNKRLKNLERLLQSMMKDYVSAKDDRFEGTWLCRPPVMVSALFLIEHSYSHFLHEGLTWRMVLDWQMFCRRHYEEIDWPEFEEMVDEFGFRKFYDSFVRVGKYLLDSSNSPTVCPEEERDLRMLEDIWAPLDLHNSVRGLRGKLALAGNTWRARWKYNMFTDMTWLQVLWIQAKGVVFEREVKL